MKKITILFLSTFLILICNQSCLADTISYTKVAEFSKWLFKDDFDKQLNNIPDNQYPIVVHGGALDGEGVVYRLLVASKPSKGFQYDVIYGVDEDVFKKRHVELTKKGYILIQHQTVQLIAFKAHQAVWIKNNL